MCSDGLRKIRLYDKYLQSKNLDIKPLYPNDEIQKLVTLGICNAKNSKRNDYERDDYPAKLFTQVCDYFSEQGVDCIVGGCTDISAVFCPQQWESINYVDSLVVLAKVIYERTKKTVSHNCFR